MIYVPSGLKDTLCNECEDKDRAIAALKKLYRAYGYRKIETPTLEYYSTFEEISNKLTSAEAVKLIDDEGNVLVLRPDVTVPIIRSVLTNYKNTDQYLKFYYNMNIFKQGKKHSYPRKEYTQAGIEYIGGNEDMADTEAVILAIESLSEISSTKPQIDIGHSEYLSAILENVEKTDELLFAIANKNRQMLVNAVKSMKLPEMQLKAILDLPYSYGSFEEVVSKAVIVNRRTELVLEKLKRLHNNLKVMELADFVTYDLAMLQEIEYYTGIIFKGYINGVGTPVLSGGRYSKSAGGSCSKNFSGVGFGIDVELIMYDNLVFDTEKDRVIVVGSSYEKVLRQGKLLRSQGKCVETIIKGDILDFGSACVIDTDEL